MVMGIKVDSGDYRIWRTHFGQTAGGIGMESITVPEPSAGISITALLLSSGRRADSTTQCRATVQNSFGV